MSLESHYPTTCPFCTISTAFPPSTNPIPATPDPTLVDPQCHLILSTPYVLAFLDILPMSRGHLLLTPRGHYEKLSDVPVLPDDGEQGQKPLWKGKAGGGRRENEGVQEGNTPAAALGFWMPLLSRALCRVLDIEDWNIVQNNGARAAQVVGHVHFHFIPRYAEGRGGKGKGKGKVEPEMLKSWRMFGRGTREELDDEEAGELAAEIREALRGEVERVGGAMGRGGRESKI